MTTPTVTETVRNGNPVGKRTELGRYTISSGERVLYGQRIGGVVRVTDNPASGRGRAVSSSEASSKTATPPCWRSSPTTSSQAERHDEIPMLVSLLDVATED